MRPIGSVLLAVGLLALGTAAVVDAVRDTESERPPPQSSQSVGEVPVRSPQTELVERDVSGTLYLTREIGGGCRFLALRLPNLRAQADILSRHCRIDLAPDSPTIALGSACPAQGVEVRDDLGRPSEPPRPGCGPAWTVSGELTLVRKGSVVVPGRGVVLSRSHFLEAIRRVPYLPRAGSYTIREAGWLDEATLVLVARHRTRAAANDFLAIFRHGRLEPAGGIYIGGRISSIFLSRSSNEIVTEGRFFWNRRGEFVSERAGVFGASAAFARSADGHWTASASRTAIYVYRTDEGPRPFDPVEIPIRNVVDLAWG